MSSSTHQLKKVITDLTAYYGTPEMPAIIDVFEMIVWENIAYLVNDERRAQVFAALRQNAGLTPEAILAVPPAMLAQWIKNGGMQPERRAEKLFTSARLALEIGLPELRRMMRDDPAEARRELMRFPGIGEPSADRLLLYSHCRRSLAPDSNGLRAMIRLGFGEEDDAYTRMYRSASAAVALLLPDDYEWIIRAHVLLQTHGRQLCKRTSPLCARCPLTDWCAWFASQRPQSK